MKSKIYANINKFATLNIFKQKLYRIKYDSAIASTQIKSATLLPRFFANNETIIFSEPNNSREHTEKLFQFLNTDIKISNNTIYLNPLNKSLNNTEFFILGDISIATFFITIEVLCSEDRILINNV